MDNKPLEMQAESLIQHNLIKHGLLVTKPFFDKEGTDLLIVKDLSEKTTPIIKVQCKGRTVKKASNVTIPVKYVKENFVVFLYVQEDETKNDFLYAFFQDDINAWQAQGSDFQLVIPKDFQCREYFKERKFTGEAIFKIENILLKQAVSQQITKTDYSIIIDGIFLEKAVVQTQAIYRELYPAKTFRKPSIDDIVEQFLKYASIERKERVNCYLIYSSDFDLKSKVDIGEIDENDFMMDQGVSSVGSRYNLFKMKTQDLLCFKVEEQLERIVSVEHVFLVADDFAYIPYLQALKDKGVEIIVFQNSENAGSRMYHRFTWADVVYPLALATGLEQHEL
jgi:hypothetical protein